MLAFWREETLARAAAAYAVADTCEVMAMQTLWRGPLVPQLMKAKETAIADALRHQAWATEGLG